MKKTLLLLALVLYAIFPALAQSFSGNMNPCPKTDYTYSITYNADWGGAYCTAFTNGIKYEQISAVVDLNGNLTSTFRISWQNVAGTGEFEIAPPFANKDHNRIKLTVNIGGVGDVQFTSAPSSLTCDFTGTITATVSPVSNANRLVWTNDAGWLVGTGVAPANGANFYVNNNNPAFITCTAYNTACPGITKSNNRGISRTDVQSAPVFIPNTSTTVCAGSTAFVTMAPGTGTSTPKGYEYYTVPAGYLTINGTSYDSPTNVYYATGNTLELLAQNNANGVGSDVKIYARSVYYDNCKSAWASATVSVGTPSSYGFTMMGSRYEYGQTVGVAACTREGLVISPVMNTTQNILNHKWEVSGTYTKVGALNGPTLALTVSPTYGAQVFIKYSYQTACGWSTVNKLQINAKNCPVDPGEGLRMVNTDTLTVEEKAPTTMTIAPNPASSNVSVTVPVAGNYKANMLVNVSDMKGSIVLTRTMAVAEKFTLDVSALPSGTYILQVQTGEKKFAKQMVITK